MSGAIPFPVPVEAVLKNLRALPVEVRRKDFALVDRTTLGRLDEAVRKLAAGVYAVGVTLPTGSTLSHEITVSEEGKIDLPALILQLASTPSINALVRDHVAPARAYLQDLATGAANYASERFPIIRNLAAAGNWASAFRVPDQSPPGYDEVKLRAFAMDAGRCDLIDPSKLQLIPRADAASVGIAAGQGDGSMLVQFLRSGYPALNAMLPPGGKLVVSVPEDGSKAVTLDVRLGVDLIDEVMRMRSLGRLDDVVALVSSLGNAEIDAYVTDTPGASIAAVYAILRSVDRSLASVIVAELEQRMPGSPDAMILAAEIASLEGRHADAVGKFVRARRAGLPLFSHGLDYLVDRLRLYVQSARKPGRPPGHWTATADMTAATEALGWAQEYGLFADFSRSLLTFTGLHPDDPDDTALSGDDVATVEKATSIPVVPFQAAQQKPS